MPTIDELLDLAIRCHQNGNLTQAEPLYRRILEANPRHADALHLLGVLALQTGQRSTAVTLIQQSLELNPNHADAHYNLGRAFQDQGQLAEASACYRAVLRLNPAHVDAYNNLGVALKNQGLYADAIACYRQALRINPNYAGAFNNLGTALYHSQAPLDEALDALQRALCLQPNCADAHNNLGNVLKDTGRLDEALACFQEARKLEPGRMTWHSNYLFSLHCHPRYDCPALHAEHQHWEHDHARVPAVAKSQPAYANEQSLERRLRIGYVSPDFRDHVLGRNIWPLIRNHDHRLFDITLYAHLPNADSLTEKFRASADIWRDVAPLSDDQVAALIRQDEIDILVDLTMHMGGNRLLIFARKPAPVQVTFAGYPGGTGLSAIDYRFTDPHLDPPGLFEPWFAEATFRLPHSFWCYDPPGEGPRPAPLPASKNNFITFGCLNNFCKVNDAVLELWASVLRAVAGSRLLLLAQEGSHRGRTLDFLARHGVDRERVAFSPRVAHGDYLGIYHQLDIGLDTFPYNGHTTSMDAFWMGVPVITLVGKTPVGRGGLSQLTNLGLRELAANDPDEFVRIATHLAADVPRLTALRQGLRRRMQQSPLMDAVGFARGIEEGYRNIWRQWCVHGKVTR